MGSPFLIVTLSFGTLCAVPAPVCAGDASAPAATVDGRPADLAPCAYTYRKGAAGNPPETQWLKPTPNVLCGLLWEERRVIRRIEVEFPPTRKRVPPATVPAAGQLRLVTRAAAAVIEEAAVPKFGPPAPKEFTLEPAGNPVVTAKGATVFTFASQNDINSIKVLYSGSDPKIGVPTVRAFGRSSWLKPLALEIQWAFQPNQAGRCWDGRVEAYNGYVGAVSPLGPGCGVTAVGEHAWKDQFVVPPSGGKSRLKPGLQTAAPRGIKLTVFQTAGEINSRTIVTLWTTGGNVSFAAQDLASGPILIPSLGIFISTAASRTTPAEFQAQLAARRLRTERQRAREEPEVSWASAMQRYYGKTTFPAFPQPPYEPPMQIDVPEHELVAQWRLGAWHMKRWSEKLPDGTYFVSIWPPDFRGMATWYRGSTAIGLESCTNIRAMDVMGVADVAQGGLDYWLFSVKHSTPWGRFAAIGDGPLTAPGRNVTVPRSRNDHYDQHHCGGHGRVLESCALHYLLTGDATWLDKARPVLQKACDWTITERKLWSRNLPPDSWCYGLQPPADVCDGGDVRLFFSASAWYYAGLKRAAEVLAGSGGGKPAGLVSEAELFRRDIRKAADRSLALAPVIKVGDGTYRRYLPFAPYMRGLGSEMETGFGNGRWFEYIMGGLLLIRSGIYDVHEPVVQELLDVYEDRLVQDGQNGQNGYNDAPALHLLLDDVPLFLRGMYNSYAAEVAPDFGYVFWEVQDRHTGRRVEGPGNARDKTFEEAAFLKRIRAMLVMEDGADLWLARATPRAWLQQGQRIAVKNAPTFFGSVAYEIRSDVDHGQITAMVEMPGARAPQAVRLRLRHPKAAPIKSVTLGGKPWPAFDKNKEAIELKGVAGTITVVANY